MVIIPKFRGQYLNNWLSFSYKLHILHRYETHFGHPNKSYLIYSKKMHMNDIIKKTSEFVKESLKGNDASHDFAHIQRVHALAENIANQECCSSDELELVSLASLLHDIADWKYSGSETAGVEAAQSFLQKLNYPQDNIDRICWIIQRVSFHDEIGRTPDEVEMMKKDKLLCIVQDADRCDAIGAIGIARCFTYGGKKGHQLYKDEGNNIVRDISKEDYMASGKNSTSIDHFYEKLLRLKEKMKTDGGRKIADGRHEFMKSYLQQFHAEVMGKE